MTAEEAICVIKARGANAWPLHHRKERTGEYEAAEAAIREAFAVRGRVAFARDDIFTLIACVPGATERFDLLTYLLLGEDDPQAQERMEAAVSRMTQAFAIAARAREELARLEAEPRENTAVRRAIQQARLESAKRILGEEGSE